MRLTKMGVHTYVVHMANDGLITTAQAAAAVGVDRRTIVRMADRGDLTPAMKLDGLRGAYLFRSEAVEALAAQRGDRR